MLGVNVKNEALYERMREIFYSLPHSRAIGLMYHATEGVSPILKLEWREDLVGNPQTGVLHGGLITSIIDTTSAISVTPHLERYETLATLDLRVDYLSFAKPGLTIYCKAECYRLSSKIGFTRAVCYQDDIHKPIAQGVATFMRASSAKPMEEGLKLDTLNSPQASLVSKDKDEDLDSLVVAKGE